MRALILLIFLSGCAVNECAPKPGNAQILAMGTEPTEKEVEEMKPLVAQLSCR